MKAHIKMHIVKRNSFLFKSVSDIELSSIFFGGGTPNLLRSKHIEEIILTLKRFVGQKILRFQWR